MRAPILHHARADLTDNPVLHASELLSTDGAETYRFLLWATNSQFAVSAFLFCGVFLEKLRRLSVVSCVSQGGGAKVHETSFAVPCTIAAGASIESNSVRVQYVINLVLDLQYI